MPRTDDDTVDELHEQLRALASRWDQQLEPLDGATIRDLGPRAAPHDHARRRRNYILTIAAASCVAALGALAAVIVGGADSETGTVPAASPATATTPSTTAPTTAPPTTTATTPATAVDEPVGFIPTPVPAGELGWPEVRLLPPASAGYQVESVAELVAEPSPADGDPAGIDGVGGEQPRRERTEYLATDPDDRRAIVIGVTTYATPSEAGAAVASPHPITNDTIEAGSAEIAGLPGAYVRTWASEELSGGDPKHQLLVATVRLHENVVVQVAALDGTLEQVAAIVGSARIDDSGRTVFDARPPGFGEPIPSSDLEIDAIPGASTASSLGLVLRDQETTATVAIEIREGATAEIDPAVLARQPAVLAGESGQGFLRHGLFGEQSLVWITDGLVITLDHRDRMLSDDELVAFADSLAPVDEATWAAGVQGITGYRSTSVPLG